MSLWITNSENKKTKSLSKHVTQIQTIGYHNGTPLCICRNASITVEAVVIIPLVAGFLAFILFFFRVLQVQTGVYQALSYSGRRTAALAGEADGGQVGLAEVFFRKELANYPLIDRYVYGGKMGISLLESNFSGEYIDLITNYRISFPIGLFQFRGIQISQESKHRKWTGRTSLIEDSNDWVYITPKGEAYHSTRNCRYLDLSMHSVNGGNVNTYRNKDGHKYHECSWCAAKKVNSSTVIITDYGVEYHRSVQCPSLKRTVQYVRASEVGGRHGCAKCVGGK